MDEDVRDRFEEDPELRALLRAADPAASLPPADPARSAALRRRIQEDEMTEQTGTTRSTRRAGLMVGAAAAALVVAGGGYAVVQGMTADRPPSFDRDVAALPGPPADEAVLTLEAGQVTGRCAVPTAELLAQFDVAFAGTVTDVTDDVATLEPTRVFAGEGVDLVDAVEVRNFAGLGLLGTPVEFEVGAEFLVAAEDGIVSPCGFSGRADGDLQRLYDDAFG